MFDCLIQLAKSVAKPSNGCIEGSQVESGILWWTAADIFQPLEDVVWYWWFNWKMSSLRLEPISIGSVCYSILHSVWTRVGIFTSTVSTIITGLLGGYSITRFISITVSTIWLEVLVLG